MKQTQVDAFETLLDGAESLSTVVSALAEIAEQKAEHLRVNWQDHHTAKAWDRAATILYKTSGRIQRETEL